MTRFNAYSASPRTRMPAASHSAEASFCCGSAMMNTVIAVMGTSLLVSIFVMSLISIRLLGSIMISILITMLSLSLMITGPRIAILKEPPDLL